MKIEAKIAEFEKAAQKTMDKFAFQLLTCNQTLVDGKWMYLDREKYKGKGRPKKSDYSESKSLYVNKNQN